MAGSVNKVILLGNVGKDPEIRATQSGSKLASFSIATTLYLAGDFTSTSKSTPFFNIKNEFISTLFLSAD